LPPIIELSGAVSEYVQPAARLIVPPPAALAALIAATKALAEHGTVAATADDAKLNPRAAATAQQPANAVIRPVNRRDPIICPS
jgi:hypothetical protein